MTRLAAVDIGTNSVRMLVADVGDGHITEVLRRSTVTGLGKGVDARRVLLPTPVTRTHTVLAEYRDLIDALGAERTLAVATSAVRDATNGPMFLADVGRTYRFMTRLVSGDEEARLIRRGVGVVDIGTLVLDVGGGSTELILADFRTSIDVGSVRLSERFLHSDPPTERELADAASLVFNLLPDLSVVAAVGVAGTVAQLHELVGELTLEAIEHELNRLSVMPLAARTLVPRMDPARAPVILGGMIVVREVLSRYGLSRLTFSMRDLLDGAIFELAEGER